MPKASITTVKDVAQGALSSMWPRLKEDGSAEVILLPEDLAEGKGNFLNLGSGGNPEGFVLGQPPKVAGRYVWIGTHPDRVTRQNTIPLLPHESSYAVNGPIVTGDPPPEFLLGGTLPKPPPPTILTSPASVAGYPAGTEEHPYYLAYSWARIPHHSPLSPKVKVPPLAQGQCIRLIIPETAPLGASSIGIWMTHPGQSTASTPAQFRLQKTLAFAAFAGGEVELRGPYVYALKTSQGTGIAAPEAPKVQFLRQRRMARPGEYYCFLTAVNDLGESVPSSAVGPITVTADSYWGSENPAGYGTLRLVRPALPSGATGWHAYVMRDGQMHRVVSPDGGYGGTRPLPSQWEFVDFGGWEASEEAAKYESLVLTSASLPEGDSTGVEPPNSPLEAPVVFGASRPAPGNYYARVSEITEEGDESPLSDAAHVDLAEDKMMNVVVGNRTNQLPNATFVEQGADGLPLFYSVTDGAGEAVQEEGGVVTLDTNGSQAGATLSLVSDPVSVDRAKEGGVGVFLELEDPKTGVFSGSFEVVLRETSPENTTDTVLATISERGEHKHYSPISPSGYPSPSWQPDTTRAQVIYRFSGSPKNMRVRISRQILKDYRYSFRRREEARGLSNPNPAPEATAPALGSVAVEPSPTPPASPETIQQDGPSRPLSTGEPLETADFASGMPSGWTSSADGATLSVSGGKLIASKAAGGSNGLANISKTFSPPSGLGERHSQGIALEGVEIPTFPTNGTITLAELTRPWDGERLAWVDLDTRSEKAELAITGAPVTSGNVTTTFDEGGSPTARTTAVIATREETSLTINADPGADGLISVSVGGMDTDVPVTIGRSGLYETVEVEITQGAATRGWIYVELAPPISSNRTSSFVNTKVLPGDTPETIARNLRAFSSTGPAWSSDLWTISGQGRLVVFTCKVAQPTPKTHQFLPQATGVQGRISVTTEGREFIAADTAATVAARIRALPFPGYTISGSDNEAGFQALEPGEKPAPSYDARDTGCAGTIAVDVPGARDAPEDVAEKVAATYSANAYWAVTSDGSIVYASALGQGVKQDATFSPGTTGTLGKMKTTVQGGIDVVVHARDSEAVRSRRVLGNLTTSTVFNLDLCLSGAGTPPSGTANAVVSLWGSLGNDETGLLALFEGLDLAEYPAGGVVAGVSAESSSSLAWEVLIDEVRVSERGEKFYRYHDYSGRLLNQVHISLPPGYLPQDGLYLQNWYQAAIPGAEITAGVFVAWDVGTNAEPFCLFGLTEWGERRPILVDGEPYFGCLTGGLSGTGEWQEFFLTFVVPEDCYALGMESRNIGAGEIVCQEFADSLGTMVKRTPLFAIEGSYVATMNISTPYMPRFMSWGRERKVFDADTVMPSGTTLEATYASSDSESGPFDTPVVDPSDVAQRNVLRATFLAASNGLATPAIRSVVAEYVLLSGRRPLSTFLAEGRRELDGGTIFGTLERPAEPPEVVYRVKPGRRFVRTPVYGPVGNLPPFELQVFTPEARKFIEDRMGIVDFAIEARDQILTVRFGGEVRFEQKTPEVKINGRWYSHYVAKMPESQVLSAQEMP